jgi:hypothetical protein
LLVRCATGTEIDAAADAHLERTTSDNAPDDGMNMNQSTGLILDNPHDLELPVEHPAQLLKRHRRQPTGVCVEVGGEVIPIRLRV